MSLYSVALLGASCLASVAVSSTASVIVSAAVSFSARVSAIGVSVTATKEMKNGKKKNEMRMK